MSLIIPFLIEYDKSQAEWVVVAYEADDHNMLSAIESGKDIHAWTASLMYNVPAEEIKEEADLFTEAGLGSETSERIIRDFREERVYPCCPGLKGAAFYPRNQTFRQAGKKSNHALNYDEGELTFAKKAGITVAEAKRLRNLYRRVYYGLPIWHSRLQFTLKAVKEGQRHYCRTLTNCFGREMRFLGPLSGREAPNTFRQAYACIPQSTVADIASNAMVEVTERMAGRVDLRSNNHDSITVQHYLNRDAFRQINSRNSEIRKIFSEVEEIIQYLDPELKSTYTGKGYRIKTDCKGGLRWGGLEKVKPTLQGVEALLMKIDKEVGG